MEQNQLKSKMSWSDFKLNSDGMVPVIVQDYKTDEVLMLAYMNENSIPYHSEAGKNDLLEPQPQRALDQRTNLRSCSVCEIIDYRL